MKKTVLGAALLLAVSAMAVAPKYPYGTVVLNGGRVEPVDMALIEKTNENLNFCFAYRYPDNTIYLSHSKGIHTVTEYGCQDYSTDNGKTWQRLTNGFTGFNCYLDRQNRKVAIGCWDRQITENHRITRTILNPDGQGVTKEYTSVKFPFKSKCYLHRDVLRLKNGTLLVTGYGLKENVSKTYSFVLSSKDDGKTWQFLSTALDKPDYVEGANESVLVELKNGDLLNYIRTGSGFMQVRSTDGGKTWSEPEMLDKVGVSPAARILKNGAIVVVTGRPGLFMLVDFTGTGKHYQKVSIYNGATSSYASVVEVAPDQVMIIYDESDFSVYRNPGFFSRMIALTLNVVKDDSLKFVEVAHPEAGKYDRFYTAANQQLPDSGRFCTPVGYKKGTPAYFEIRTIPERPHPVLHLEHRGVEQQVKCPHFSIPLDQSATTGTVGFELRLADAGEKRAQFYVSLFLKDPKTQGHRYAYVALATTKINYYSGGRFCSVPCDLGTKFNAFILKASALTGEYQLFKKGETKPLLTGKMNVNNNTPVGCNFGDGATAVFGAVDLSYIGVKTN